MNQNAVTGAARIVRDRAPLTYADRRADAIDRRGDQVFFWWAKEGQWHHVYDVAIVRGRVRRVPYESKRATHRFFVIPAEHQWRYTFGTNALRSITTLELGRQRAASKFHLGKNQHGSNGGACS